MKKSKSCFCYGKISARKYGCKIIYNYIVHSQCKFTKCVLNFRKRGISQSKKKYP